jgi:hypothetical protein
METTNASEEKIFQMVKAGEKQKNGAADKNIVHPIEYAFKELKTDNAYEPFHESTLYLLDMKLSDAR